MAGRGNGRGGRQQREDEPENENESHNSSASEIGSDNVVVDSSNNDSDKDPGESESNSGTATQVTARPMSKDKATIADSSGDVVMDDAEDIEATRMIEDTPIEEADDESNSDDDDDDTYLKKQLRRHGNWTDEQMTYALQRHNNVFQRAVAFLRAERKREDAKREAEKNEAERNESPEIHGQPISPGAQSPAVKLIAKKVIWISDFQTPADAPLETINHSLKDNMFDFKVALNFSLIDSSYGENFRRCGILGMEEDKKAEVNRALEGSIGFQQIRLVVYCPESTIDDSEFAPIANITLNVDRSEPDSPWVAVSTNMWPNPKVPDQEMVFHTRVSPFFRVAGQKMSFLGLTASRTGMTIGNIEMFASLLVRKKREAADEPAEFRDLFWDSYPEIDFQMGNSQATDKQPIDMTNVSSHEEAASDPLHAAESTKQHPCCEADTKTPQRIIPHSAQQRPQRHPLPCPQLPRRDRISKPQRNNSSVLPRLEALQAEISATELATQRMQQLSLSNAQPGVHDEQKESVDDMAIDYFKFLINKHIPKEAEAIAQTEQRISQAEPGSVGRLAIPQLTKRIAGLKRLRNLLTIVDKAITHGNRACPEDFDELLVGWFTLSPLPRDAETEARYQEYMHKRQLGEQQQGYRCNSDVFSRKMSD